MDASTDEDYHRMPGRLRSRSKSEGGNAMHAASALNNIAPEIFRQRLLIEGFFGRAVDVR
jgi:hypothetical protein